MRLAKEWLRNVPNPLPHSNNPSDCNDFDARMSLHLPQWLQASRFSRDDRVNEEDGDSEMPAMKSLVDGLNFFCSEKTISYLLRAQVLFT